MAPVVVVVVVVVVVGAVKVRCASSQQTHFMSKSSSQHAGSQGRH